MNIPDYQHESNRRELERLTKFGFKFEINSDGYFVKFNETGIGGASVMLPRKKKIHWQHARANLRDNLAAALRTARNSRFYPATITPVQHEVGRPVRGRPSYAWVTRWQITTPNGSVIAPPMLQREAINFCKREGWNFEVRR